MKTDLFFFIRIAAFLYDAKERKRPDLSPGLFPRILINHSPIRAIRREILFENSTHIRNAIIPRFSANPTGKTYANFPVSLNTSPREKITPIMPKNTAAHWKLNSAQSKVNELWDTLCLSFAIKYSCAGWPPVEEGVTELKKNPAKEYFIICAKVMVQPESFRQRLILTPSAIA